MKVFYSFAKPDGFVDVEQMMGVFVETGDSLCRQAASQSKHEIVVRQLSLDFTVRDSDSLFGRIDAGDLGFDEVNAPVKHRVAQIERHVVNAAFAKCQPH